MHSLNKLTLIKYANRSADLLNEYCSHDYTSEDVVKVATALIERDIRRANQIDKIAVLTKSGKHVAKGFLDELKRSTT